MAHAILLKYDGPDSHDFKSVSGGNHVYPVVDGYVLVDIRPYLSAPAHIPNPEYKMHNGISEDFRQTVPNPGYDPHADAEADAMEIASLALYSPAMLSRVRLFRRANKAETEAWIAVPANKARLDGVPYVPEAEPKPDTVPAPAHKPVRADKTEATAAV